MHLDVGGHPLHTRALSVSLEARADGRWDARGTVLDLRKRGFVPVGSALQPAGIVHHMTLEGVIDPAAACLESIAAAQASVAFEASAITRGESCRDPLGRVALLAGAILDDGWAKRLSADIGGANGCSHVLTLAQLFGPTISWAIGRERTRFGGILPRRPGERIYRRDVVIDGHERSSTSLALALQLTDVHHAPAAPIAPSMDRFAEEHEVRGLGLIDFPSFTITDMALGERRRDIATLDTARWQDRGDIAGACAGLSLMRGVTATLLARRADAPTDHPVFDGLLMLAPALIQCVAALSDGWPRLAADGRWVVGMGGRPDSCYMWRAGGALQTARAGNEPPTA